MFVKLLILKIFKQKTFWLIVELLTVLDSSSIASKYTLIIGLEKQNTILVLKKLKFQ